MVAGRNIGHNRGTASVGHVHRKPTVIDAVFMFIDKYPISCRRWPDKVGGFLNRTITRLAAPGAILPIPYPAIHRQAASARIVHSREVNYRFVRGAFVNASVVLGK